MAANLATLKDLDKYHVAYEGRETLAKSLLAAVSAAVRAAAMNPIKKQALTVTIPAGQTRALRLPAQPVISVESVQIQGEPLDGWMLVGGSLWLDHDWAGEGHVPTPVTVSFTAGFKTVPEDIIRLVCSFVAAGLTQDADGGPGAHRGLAYERVDDVQFGYQQGNAEVVDACELPKATQEYLRRRFSGGITSVGVLR